jgi:hypothetical protein
VIRIRDVVFNEKERFSGKFEDLEHDDLLALTTEEIPRLLILQETQLSHHSSPVFGSDDEVWEAPRRRRNREDEVDDVAVEEAEPVIDGPVQCGR